VGRPSNALSLDAWPVVAETCSGVPKERSAQRRTVSRRDTTRCSGGVRGHGRPAATPDFVPNKPEVIACSTEPPEQATVICADELGPVIPRSFPTRTRLEAGRTDREGRYTGASRWQSLSGYDSSIRTLHD
jgi:hypothetical protein